MNKLIQLLIIFLLVSNSAIAEEREWETNVKLDASTTLTLHWVGVYEGRDTVYKITLNDDDFHLGKNDAVGQPVLNKQKTYIALPYCADDGCSQTINLFDINKKRLLHPIQLKYEGQFYVDCKWNQNSLYIDVDHGPFQGQSMIDHYIADVESGRISLKKLTASE